MREEIPEVINRTQIVGSWVWLEFNTPPIKSHRDKLKSLGFHWNGKRACWQHPCGMSRQASLGDPRQRFAVIPARELSERELRELALEYKVVALKECPLPESLAVCDTPDKALEYWRLHVQTNPHFNPECECFAVLLLNTRRKVKGHQLISIGTLDTLLVHPREVFRGAIIAAASSIVLMHNHPSGEADPSEADIKVTRDLIRAGQLLKIEILDHIIVGNGQRKSLRELGYFYA
jgi:DNA repair protein RadC